MGILEEIKQGIPNRFANITPYHFEELICELFKDSGYRAEVTKSTGDFGVDVILIKDNIRVAVQAKKYQRGSLVGVKDVNQVIGGKEYYKCDKTIVVTTSDFTKAARKLAEQASVELWNWDKLHNEIREVYLEGKDVYEFFVQQTISTTQNQGGVQKDSKDRKFVFHIERIRENVELKGGDIATVVHIKMINTTNEKVYITVGTPIIITTLGNQVEAYSGYVGRFNRGYIYPQANVPIIFCWYYDQVPNGKIIKNIIMKYYEEGYEEPKEVFISPDLSASIIDDEKFAPYRPIPEATQEPKDVYLTLGRSTQIIKVICPSCNQEFHYKIIKEDIVRGAILKRLCPRCAVVLNFNIRPKSIFKIW